MSLEIPTYATIVFRLSKQIDLLTKTYTHEGYAALSYQIAPAIASCCILYIVVTGYLILSGKIDTPIKEFQKIVFRIGVVYTFALNWHFFSSYISRVLTDGASEIGAILMNANPLPMPSGVTGINTGLQTVLIEIVRVGTWTWNKGSWTTIGPYFTGLLIYFSGFAVVGLAFFEIAISKIMLSVLMCTAPVFFTFTFFDRTRPFFDRWLGTLVGYSFVMIFVSSVVGLAVSLLHWSIGAHYLSKAINLTLTDWIPILFVAGLCSMAVLEISSIAKSIGGSCSNAGTSAMVGGLLGGVVGVSSRALLASKNPAKALGFTAQKSASLPFQAIKAGRYLGESAHRGANNMMSLIKRMRSSDG